jgi:hypothetical protein
MRGRLLLPVVGLAVWGTFGTAACSASKDGPGLHGTGASSAKGGNGAGGLVIGMSGSGGSLSALGGSESATGGMAPLPPHTMCSADMACGTGLTCVKGKGEPDHCAPTGVACTMDSECGGDRYCCADGCLLVSGPAVCIPYGYGPRGNVNAECKGAGAPPGVFAPSVQCEWKVKPTDPHPTSGLVLSTPMVADLPNDSGASAEIVFASLAAADGDPFLSVKTPGVIRIISGQTCELKETIEASSGIIRAGSPLALADLNGDGTIEIVGRKDAGGMIAFSWDGTKYAKMWESPGTIVNQPWDGPSIHDVNDDGMPEVLLSGQVVNGQTGAEITNFTVSQGFNGYQSVAGDFNGDGKVDLATSFGAEVTYLSFIGTAWVDQAFQGTRWKNFGTHFAVADFGTPGATAADFDPKTLDGIAEVVATNAEAAAGKVSIYTLTGQEVMSVITMPDPGIPVPVPYEGGGPPTIGDFDNDGFPEVGIAGATRFRVFDFDCKNGGAGCEGPFVRWSQRSQDSSSRQTSASIFDFDGDGKAEAVYADECFLRVYDGLTGDVLFSSSRTSATWLENAVIADVDKDDNTEIVVNSASAVSCPSVAAGMPPSTTPFVDPLHKGVRCDDDMGCTGGAKCGDGYCRCTGDTQCDAGTTCVAPIAGTAGTGNVCRATNSNGKDAAGGVKVLRDRLDRWASSRPMWNQHAYSITNINDDGTIPKTSAWMQNWKQKGLNNYRANVQGKTGFADYPDITGALYADKVCSANDGGGVTLTATVCNRGKKAVGADMPATFYEGDPAAKKILCTSYTKGPVPVGGCLDVSCDVPGEVIGTVTMVVNDDGKGGMTTVECNSDNNTDDVMVKSCKPK